jgi:hypothetical protein
MVGNDFREQSFRATSVTASRVTPLARRRTNAALTKLRRRSRTP